MIKFTDCRSAMCSGHITRLYNSMLYWQFIALSETPSQSYRILLAI